MPKGQKNDDRDTLEAIARLTELPADHKELAPLLDAIVELAAQLLNADRGDILLWNESRNKLLFAARYKGKSKSVAADIGEEAEEPSINRHLWEKRESLPFFLAEDVKDYPDLYAEWDHETQSELAVLIRQGGRDLGIINLESYHVSHFDEHDKDTLERLAGVIGSVLQSALDRSTFRGVRHGSGIDKFPPKEILSDILRSVTQPLGMEAGHMMLCSPDGKALDMVAYFDSDPDINPDIENFSHLLSGHARTVQVYRRRTVDFCPNVKKERKKFDENGLKTFKISGSWLGVPLISGTEVYGVIAFWNRKGSNLKNVPINLFLRISRLLVGFLERWNEDVETEKLWGEGLEGIEEIVAATPEDGEWSDYISTGLKYILLASLAGNFDRIRVFQFDRNRSVQRCIWAFRHETDEIFAGDELPLLTPYNSHLIENAFYDRSARVFNELEFGPDKNAKKLRKPKGLSWVQMPLVIDGRLFGQIAVDNAHTQNAIMPGDLEIFDLAGRIIGNVSDYVLTEKRRHTVIDNLPVVAWEKDLDGVFTYASAHFRKIMTPRLEKLGVADIVGLKDKDLFPKLWKTYVEGDERARNETFRTKERFEKHDGSTIPIDVIKGPVKDFADKVIGTMGLWWDTTEVMSDIEWAHDTGSIGTVEWELKDIPDDAEKSEKGWAALSPGLYKIFGLSRDESVSHDFKAFYNQIDRRDRDDFIVFMARLMARGDYEENLLNEVDDPLIWDRVIDEIEKHGPLELNKEYEIELRIKRSNDNASRIIQTRFKRDTADPPRPERVILMVQDITEIVAEKDAIVREIHHRIRNQIMSLDNILRHATTRARDIETNELLETVRGRLVAMGLVHESLYQSLSGSTFNFSTYVSELCKSLSSIFKSDDKEIEIITDVEPMQITDEVATPCALIITELIWNARKHAFPDRELGKIWISVGETAENEVSITVADDGIGMGETAEKPQRHSGMELIHGLARQLQGQLIVDELHKTGSIVILTFPKNIIS